MRVHVDQRTIIGGHLTRPGGGENLIHGIGAFAGTSAYHGRIMTQLDETNLIQRQSKDIPRRDRAID
jgi:hypothetical protein